MVRNVIPQTRTGKITVVLLLVAYAALAPPAVWIADTPELVAGFPPLYLWTLVWGSFMAVVLLWAAWRDAWGIRADQVPPELRDQTGTIGFTDTDREPASGPEPSAAGEAED